MKVPLTALVMLPESRYKEAEEEEEEEVIAVWVVVVVVVVVVVRVLTRVPVRLPRVVEVVVMEGGTPPRQLTRTGQ